MRVSKSGLFCESQTVTLLLEIFQLRRTKAFLVARDCLAYLCGLFGDLDHSSPFLSQHLATATVFLIICMSFCTEESSVKIINDQVPTLHICSLNFKGALWSKSASVQRNHGIFWFAFRAIICALCNEVHWMNLSSSRACESQVAMKECEVVVSLLSRKFCIHHFIEIHLLNGTEGHWTAKKRKRSKDWLLKKTSNHAMVNRFSVFASSNLEVPTFNPRPKGQKQRPVVEWL